MARYQYRYRRPQRRHFPVKGALIVLVVLLLCIYPFVEASLLIVDRHTVTVANLPANLRNLKIAFLSDVHQCAWFSQSRVNDLVKTVNSLSADIVILGGDYATDCEGAIRFFKNLPALSARIGIYAILGDSDRLGPEEKVSTLVGEIKSRGMIPLVNNLSAIKMGKNYLYIVGADDFYNGYPQVSQVAAQVKAEDFVIFAGHSPDLMPEMLSAVGSDGDNHWFDLALFGHTHGGQINLLGFSPFFTLHTDVGKRYQSGWLEENRAAVLVSNGVGTIDLPVRLFAMPQIHLITLRSR